MSELEYTMQQLLGPEASRPSSPKPLTPVNALPNEILCHIFSLLLSEEMHAFEMYEVLGTISEVCYHWKSALSTNATFWTNIVVDTTKPSTFEDADAFLCLSKEAPLEVELDHYFPQGADVGLLEEWMGSLSGHAGRIQKCVITYPNDIYPFLRMLEFPAPNLEVLKLQSCYGEDPRSQMVLPEIFGGHLPGLKSLTLDWITSWPVDLFVNLTEVLLRRQPASQPVSVDHFLDFLSRSPQLEDLCLLNYGPMEDRDGEREALSLPNLHKLRASWSPSRQILSHLVLPKSCQIVVDNFIPFICPHEETMIEDCAVLSTLPFSAKDHVTSLADMKHLSFEIHWTQLVLAASSSSDSATSPQLEVKELFPMYDDAGMRFLDRSLVSITNELPVKSLQSLSLSAHSGVGCVVELHIPAERWAHWFSDMNQLTELQVSMSTESNIYRGLATTLGRNGNTEEVSVPCPMLKSLSITVGTPKDAGPCEELLKLLKFRSEVARRPIQKLCVQASGDWDEEHWVESFGKFVDEVEFVTCPLADVSRSSST